MRIILSLLLFILIISCDPGSKSMADSREVEIPGTNRKWTSSDTLYLQNDIPVYLSRLRMDTCSGLLMIGSMLTWTLRDSCNTSDPDVRVVGWYRVENESLHLVGRDQAPNLFSVRYTGDRFQFTADTQLARDRIAGQPVYAVRTYLRLN